jgi:hypothetical protein
VTELGTLGTDVDGNTNNYGEVVNSSGIAIGEGYKYVNGENKGYRGIRWDASGAATELGNLGTDDDGLVSFVLALYLDDSGTAAGVSDKYVGGQNKGERAVRWDPAGNVTELGGLGTDISGYTNSAILTMNNNGIAAGFCDKYDGSGNFLNARAVMWGSDGVAIDLNTLIDPNCGWVDLYFATGISNDNWISGVGTFDPDGAGPLEAYDRPFLLHVPEPTCLSALVLSLLAARSRRRRVLRV